MSFVFRKEDAVVEDLLYLTDLYDFYGALLTEKQQECMELHLFEDFSLSEIGETLGISRQAVHDTIHRSQRAMEDYEVKLGLARRYREERRELGEIYRMVAGLRQRGNAASVNEILCRLSPLLEKDREV